MDLKVYYRRIREIEAELADNDVIIVSLETPDGGREGVYTEVPKHLAAKSIVEGRARLASEEEAARFRKATREASERTKEEAVAGKLQVEIVGDRRSSSRKKEKPAS